jgi:ABC-type multidrug transport system ATPase subunit
MQHVLQVQNLTKKFKDVTAVNNLSFSIQAGEVYGFLGQNGAGKSTTIRMALTLIKPTTGSIELFGKNVYAHRNDALRQIGAVIEKPDLYKYLNGFENIKLFSKLSGISITKNQIDETLKQCGIYDRAQHKVKTYSQGMRQRLGIAIALVHNPKFVILDEPTNGLDPQGIADIRQLIKNLSNQGKTVLVSSHLLYEIEQMATNILIIHQGKKIAEGKTSELIDTNNLIVEWHTNEQDKNKLQQFFADKNITTTKEANGNISMSTAKEQIPVLNQAITNQGIPIYAVSWRNNLENYFLQVTQ